MAAVLNLVTAILGFVMAIALLDQWQERRGSYQLSWAIGSLLFGIAAGAEAIGAAAAWTPTLFRIWYLAGAVLNVGWLGLGTAFLLGRTRFGYAYAVLVALGGIIAVLTQVKNQYPDAGVLPFVYLIFALVVAVAVGVATYFQSQRWPRFAAAEVVAVTIFGTILVLVAPLPDGPLALDIHGVPVLGPLPGSVRLLTPLMNVTGGLALIVGALFSAYVFMPKRRVLDYSLNPTQTGDEMLFNLLIAPVAIVVNFVASLPGAFAALLTGRLHSRVPATILIAVGALFITGTDFGVKGGETTVFALSKLIGIALIFAGFLISIEAFREIRIPFTSMSLSVIRREPGASASPTDPSPSNPDPSGGAEPAAAETAGDESAEARKATDPA